MLVLSRQRDETIMIGDEIEITVVDIRGDKVRLGITAPTRIAVHRKEVYEAIKKENEQASRIAGPDLTALGGIAPGPARSQIRASRLAPTAAPAGREAQKPDASGPKSNGARTVRPGAGNAAKLA